MEQTTKSTPTRMAWLTYWFYLIHQLRFNSLSILLAFYIVGQNVIPDVEIQKKNPRAER